MGEARVYGEKFEAPSACWVTRRGRPPAWKAREPSEPNTRCSAGVGSTAVRNRNDYCLGNGYNFDYFYLCLLRCYDASAMMSVHWQ